MYDTTLARWKLFVVRTVFGIIEVFIRMLYREVQYIAECFVEGRPRSGELEDLAPVVIDPRVPLVKRDGRIDQGNRVVESIRCILDVRLQV